MTANLEAETKKLIQSWMQYDGALLRDYLVSGVEDPRVNTQSILTRDFLTTVLFDDRYAELTNQELRFALVMNWLLNLKRTGAEREEFEAIQHALHNKSDNAEGIEIPHFLLNTFDTLPLQIGETIVPNYIADFLGAPETSNRQTGHSEQQLDTFQNLWKERLKNETDQIVSVVEPACGSANDYRCFEGAGLSRFLYYTGFDLCEKNILNSRTMFPRVRFEVGNAFEIKAEDNAYDYCFVHDLFEHLSIEGMEAVISEICRVTKKAICAGFFQMDEIHDHIVRPVDHYHWNKLSMAKTRALFERQASEVQALHVDTFLRFRFNYSETHNKDAYTFIVSI